MDFKNDLRRISIEQLRIKVESEVTIPRLPAQIERATGRVEGYLEQASASGLRMIHPHPKCACDARRADPLPVLTSELGPKRVEFKGVAPGRHITPHWILNLYPSLDSFRRRSSDVLGADAPFTESAAGLDDNALTIAELYVRYDDGPRRTGVQGIVGAVEQDDLDRLWLDDSTATDDIAFRESDVDVQAVPAAPHQPEIMYVVLRPGSATRRSEEREGSQGTPQKLQIRRGKTRTHAA